MSSFLEQLERRKDDRGLMANLRCYLVDSKRSRAWPALHRLGIDIVNQPEESVVAALFATHPENHGLGNFGSLCRNIEYSRGDKRSDDSKLSPMERRFQHLLAAEQGDELHDRLGHLVRMAKAAGLPINYQQLLNDIKHWNTGTKTKWAAAYWTPNVEQVPGGEVI
jgi:CRISPR system Cascade subunit CasB